MAVGKGVLARRAGQDRTVESENKAFQAPELVGLDLEHVGGR